MSFDVRQFIRSGLRMLGLLLSLILLVAVAWVLSNLRDIEAVPPAAELTVGAPQLPDQRNAFFALTGLLDSARMDPAVAGQARWATDLAIAAQLNLVDPAKMTSAMAVQIRSAAAQQSDDFLPSLSGPPSVCADGAEACVSNWIADAEALAAQRLQHAALGQRCDALMGGERFEFEELLPPVLNSNAPFLTFGIGAASCSRWFLTGAVLEWTQGRPLQAVRRLQQADRLSRALLAGSRTLVGQMIAMRLAHTSLTTISELALRDAAIAAQLQPLLAPLPDAAQSIRRWIATEATFQRNMIELTDAGWGDAVDTMPGMPNACLVESLNLKLQTWLRLQRIGFHIHRIQAAIDSRLMAMLAALDSGLPALVARQQALADARAQRAWWQRLAWRNTLGNSLLDSDGASFQIYLMRQIDLELHLQAAALAVAAQASNIAATERAEWATRQPVAEYLRTRLRWSDDGQVLHARLFAPPGRHGGMTAASGEIQIRWLAPARS